jgi:hypothetical protein
MRFGLSTAPWRGEGSGYDPYAIVSAKVGWSDEALHVHVHVLDDAVYPDPDDTTLWNGDSVQVFVAGSNDLDGNYSGTEAGGAKHVLVSPDGRGLELYEYPSLSYSAYPSEDFAARIVDDGYEVELRIPWSSAANPRTRGTNFGFALVVTSDDSGSGVEVEGGVAVYPSTTPATICEDEATPGCDNRTWCTPSLE